MGNHRGASSDANAERLGFSPRIISWRHESETAKSLPVCKAVSCGFSKTQEVPLEVIGDNHPR